MVKISPEWFTSQEQGKSSGRIATFSLWTGMFKNNPNFGQITGIQEKLDTTCK